VLSVAFSNELKEELKGKAFSLLIDETTDTSTTKILAVLVRHCDTRSHQIVDDLLGLVEVVSATGENLFTAIEGIPVYFSYVCRYRKV
jgi:hypothetical protein